MATAATHLVSGIDGKSSIIWPVNAISFNPKTGVFRDIKNRVVKAPADRMGVGMDSSDGGRPAKRSKSVGKDNADKVADALVRKLLPTLKRLSAEAEAQDDMQHENRDLFGAEAEDEDFNEKAGIVNVSKQSKTRKDWLAINERNRIGRGRAYAPVSAAASKGH